MLTGIDEDRIAEAVTKAEEGTSGDILVVVADEVSRYREVPLAWAAGLSLSIPPLVMAFTIEPLTGFLSDLWTLSEGGGVESALNFGLGVYAAAQILLFLVLLALIHVPAVRRPLTPRVLKRHRVAKAAQHQFVTLSARATGSETGVLIFVALEDRQVQILADAGIHQKCGETPWTLATAAIVQAMRAGQDPTGGIVEAVGVCGAALREHYPSSGPRQRAFSPRPLEI